MRYSYSINPDSKTGKFRFSFWENYPPGKKSTTGKPYQYKVNISYTNQFELSQICTAYKVSKPDAFSMFAHNCLGSIAA